MGAAAGLRTAIREQLWVLRPKSRDELVSERYEKFRRMGRFDEATAPAAR